MKKLAAIFFDMDGLLIDSEPLWREVEVEVLTRYGVPLTLEKCRETMGIRIDEVVNYWYEQYPWTEKSVDEVVKEIIAGVIAAIVQKGEAKKGADMALAEAKKMNVPLALVSSSAMNVIHAVIERLNLQNIFVGLDSAQDELFGKPHPGVYLTAAKKLGVEPEHCIAFEDSLNGVIAAKAAKMKCIAVPDPIDRDKKEFGVADVVLNSLEEVNQSLFEHIIR